MIQQLFVNLPVTDLKKSMAFFEAMGFTFNETFTDEQAACLVLGENISAMLLSENKFKDFTKKSIANAHKQTECLVALQVDNREVVDALIEKALAAGGRNYMDAKDYGFMYQHSFEDLDGHQWEVFFMDESQFPG